MSSQDFEGMRRAMVESQLRTTDVSDPALIAAMASVPRERFVPDALRSVAYMDRSIPLAPGRALSPPLALGLMLMQALPDRADKVLIVGANTGYSAAVIARLAGEIVALEEDAGLAAQLRERVAANVTVVEGPLAEGAADGAPYQLIVIDGAVEQVPASLTDQLADGGALVTGIIDQGITRIAAGRKHGTAFGLTTIADSEVAILPGFARPRGFRF